VLLEKTWRLRILVKRSAWFFSVGMWSTVTMRHLHTSPIVGIRCERRSFSGKRLLDPLCPALC